MGYKKQVFRSLAMVTQLGISVMTPIFLCRLLDRQSFGDEDGAPLSSPWRAGGRPVRVSYG